MQTQPGLHISVMVATTALLFMTRFISPNRGMPGQLGGLELTMTHTQVVRLGPPLPCKRMSSGLFEALSQGGGMTRFLLIASTAQLTCSTK